MYGHVHNLNHFTGKRSCKTKRIRKNKHKQKIKRIHNDKYTHKKGGKK